MTTSAQEQVLALLKGHGRPDSKGRVKQLCPFHADTDASLLVYPSGAARCFGGCDRFWRPKEFSAALAELMGALLEREGRPSRRRPARWQEPEAVYPYHDAQGNLLYEVLRLPGKDFRMRWPDPGSHSGWSWNVPQRIKVPYRLAELHTAPLEQWVFVPEGEGDADRLRLHGLAATTNPYTPTHASWLNQIEVWFSILTRAVLRGLSATDPRQVCAAIDRFTAAQNEHPIPFEWTRSVVHPGTLKHRYGDLRK